MTETVLPQLEEIIVDLTAQKATAEAHLTEIQTKLEAVQAAISLFNDVSTRGARTRTTTKPATKTAARRKSSTAKQATPTTTRTSKKSTSASTTKQSVRKTAKKSKKADARLASWQQYTRDDIGEQAMPEAVRLVLSTQPKKDFKIAEVMSSLFNEDMPKAQYLRARNRISNILSGGVRGGEWFKGDRGAYRLTQ